MASPPAGQSCDTCPFCVNNECHRATPVLASNDQAIFPPIPIIRWCANWNVWPGKAAGALPGVAVLTYGSTAPNPAAGANGDFYVEYRTDGVSISEIDIFQKQSGAWVATATITP